MKRIKHYLLLLAVLALGLSSCSKDQAYQYALPADAYSVCSFNLTSMAKKAGITNSKEGELQKHLIEKLSDSEEAEAYYKELIDHPSKSGIDLKSPLFLFSNEKVSLGYLLRVDDKGKLEACVNKLRKFRNKDAAALKAEDGIFFDIDEDSTEPKDVKYDESEHDVIEGISDTIALQALQPSDSTYHVSGNVTLYAFNDKAFISLNTSESTIEETKQLAKQYLSQTKDKSYVATPAFRDLKKQEGDICGVLSMTKFLDSSYGKSMTANIAGLSDATNFDGIDMKKCYMLYSVSFETGEVVGTMTYGSEDKEILKKLKKLAEEVSPKSVQDDLVKYLPKDSYITAAATISAQKLLEDYSKLPDLKEALSKLKAEGVDIEAIVPTLGEEIAFTFPHIDVEQSEFGFVGYLKTKDATLVDMLYQQAEKEHPGKYVKEGDHRYRLAEDPFFLGFQDGVTYLAYGSTGREQLFKTSDENFTKHSEYNSLKKNNSFCYIDLKKLLTTAPTADLLQVFIGEKAKSFRVLQSLRFTGSQMETKMSLKLASQENSLKALGKLFVALQ